jgi:hypothetical protein
MRLETTMNQEPPDGIEPLHEPGFTGSDTEPVQAWEQVADGRYMPRRVRGSCHGRELG